MFQISIDRGGTFTDVYAQCPDGSVKVMKLLSVDPAYSDAPTEAIRRLLESYNGSTITGNSPIPTDQLECIRMGTTVATNALLERKGEPTALVITKGFRDLLFIGNQSRPNIFDLRIVTPDNIYTDVVEVDERIVVDQPKTTLHVEGRRVKATTGDGLIVARELDVTQLRKDLLAVYDKGVLSLAVVFLHSYIYPEHELLVSSIARDIGFTQVSLSAEVMPMMRVVARGNTTCVDAYLTPSIKRYLAGFTAAFKDNLAGSNVLFMQSDGGLTPMSEFCGSRAILSGPAGGVVGAAATGYGVASDHKPIIGFDMGGTSTDVSRYHGDYENIFEAHLGGIMIQAPQMDINTIAAGGGSCVKYDSGLFVVGPESAGAHPGPACYRKGGPATITDTNLVLGRILPKYFPKIFGPNRDQGLDVAASRDALISVSTKSDASIGHMSLHEIALGFVKVANETMCRPIRELTEAKGFDTSQHVLVCFGGAGAQHACSIARTLGISKVLIHEYSSILSAYGIACANVVREQQEPCSLIYSLENFPIICQKFDALVSLCSDHLTKQGFSKELIKNKLYLNLRYKGTDCALMVSNNQDTCTQPRAFEQFRTTFLDAYKREFGFTMPDRDIFVDDIRVRCSGGRKTPRARVRERVTTTPNPIETTDCVFDEGVLETGVYNLALLKCGQVVSGPAILIDDYSTILLEPNCKGQLTDSGNFSISILEKCHETINTDLNSVHLSIFSHRFMSIAEQMGRVLQRTAISTNIKERLDFSCAMFGPDGGLVANAPHIPVHLGAMSETIQYQLTQKEVPLSPGNVLLSNHPSCGGSHLPDLTVITPVYYKGQDKPVFFVANRGHHADIGGTTPGSMPPDSTTLNQEGACFRSFLLVKEGVFQLDRLTEKLLEPGNYPGCSGSRNLPDSISDLKAQIAANQKGIVLINELIDEYGLEVVQAYMVHIRSNAEHAVRNYLKEVCIGSSAFAVVAEDFMDDGTKIQLNVQICREMGSAIFDFSGTGREVYGNTNATKAVVSAAVIYSLRCLVDKQLPLNQGCLTPIQIIIPDGSILKPSEEAAVVGGNVLTSQRLVDVILKAFGACSASQGCMNNITMGSHDWGYYETVAGGAGAGPGWDGRSGVHTHMTNTRITDPEVLESRYPCLLRRFEVNSGTGGDGLFCGGDGLVREVQARASFTLCIMSERRSFQPYGLAGGMPGTRGLNLLMRANGGRTVNVGAKQTILMGPGDTFHLETPGGGGYGPAAGVRLDRNEPPHIKKRTVSRTTDGCGSAGSLAMYKLNQESA